MRTRISSFFFVVALLFCASTEAKPGVSVAAEWLMVGGESQNQGMSRQAFGVEVGMKTGRLTIEGVLRASVFSIAYNPRVSSSLQMQAQAAFTSLSAGTGLSYEVVCTRQGWFCLSARAELEYSIGRANLRLNQLNMLVKDSTLDFTDFAAENMQLQADWSSHSIGIGMLARVHRKAALTFDVGYKQFRMQLNGTFNEKGAELLKSYDQDPKAYAHRIFDYSSVAFAPGIMVGPFEGWKFKAYGVGFSVDGNTFYYAGAGISRDL